MRLIAVFITALFIYLFCCPLGLCKEKKAAEAEKPVVVATAEKVARGKTFTDKKAENVSFTLKPLGALLKISF